MMVAAPRGATPQARLWRVIRSTALLLTLPGWAVAQVPAGAAATAPFVGYTVQITANFPDSPENGFGFITGVQNGRAIIATADHVVRRVIAGQLTAASQIEIRFAADPARAFSANLLPVRLPLAGGDLAALEISVPPSFPAPTMPIEPSYELEVGTSTAWRIGKMGRFVPPLLPGQFVGRRGAYLLEFDDLDTPEGSSGGPIVSARGLVGMVISTAGFGSVSQVLPSDTIGGKFREWHLPWSFRSAPAAAAPEAAPRPSTPAPLANKPQAPATAPTPPPRTPVAPLTPAAMERLARQLVQAYFAVQSADPGTAARVLEQAYGPLVIHGAQPMPRAELLEQKRVFAEQWPKQRWTIQPGSFASRCSQVVATCQVTARVAWQWSNRALGMRAGSSSFTFSIAFPDGQPRILIEQEQVG